MRNKVSCRGSVNLHETALALYLDGNVQLEQVVLMSRYRPDYIYPFAVSLGFIGLRVGCFLVLTKHGFQMPFDVAVIAGCILMTTIWSFVIWLPTSKTLD